LVADEPEGKADQDWREGRQPRPLCRLPDGRGRHSEKPVHRHPAAGRRTTATAHYIHSVRRSIVMRSMQSVGKVRLDDGKHNIFRSPARRRPARRPSTRCCGDSRLPGTPVRDNIRLKSAAIRGMSAKESQHMAVAYSSCHSAGTRKVLSSWASRRKCPMQVQPSASGASRITSGAER
jgi:hypothetical protein